MKQDFDNIAKEYDETFTHTQIGKYQRDLVYGFLQTELIDFKEKTILEINGGTGEDAIWLAQKGAAVTCTDISEEMVEVAKQKAVEENQSNVVFKQLDITQISNNFNDQKFDVIFSNFGGLNCLTEKEFKQFLNDAHKILNPNGKLIMVIMPSFCLWETNYFLSKLKLKQAFRRKNKKGVAAQVGDLHVKTFYYSPKKVIKKASLFIHESTHPVGFFIPPSYLEPFFNKRLKFLKQLFKYEQKIKNKSFLAPSSDHYFISLKNK
jgi:ubiquinone/menaquinone biosynthesis C-methylase UbiE